MSGGDTGLELGGVRPRSECPLFLGWRRQTAQLSNEAKGEAGAAWPAGPAGEKGRCSGPGDGKAAGLEGGSKS